MSVVKSLIATSLAFGLVSVLGCSSDSVDETAPVITNLSHTDNQKVIGSRTITLSADASDEVAISSVVITHNGASQTVTNNSGNYSASITLEDRTNNVIVITANDSRNSVSETITLDYPFHAFTNGQAASVVIGQPDFDSFDANQGGSTAANTISSPYAVKIINNNLYIADRDNNRVLGYTTIPTTNNANADFVIGQDSFTTNTSGYANNQLTNPRAIESGDSQFFIGHAFDARINHWSSIPTSNLSADMVIGQSDFVSGTIFVCNSDTFVFGLNSIIFVDGKLIASDLGGNRILIWNTVPTVNGVPPDMVLGQQDLTHCAANDTDNDNVAEFTSSSSTLDFPKGLWSDGTRLLVADSGNNRVLVWNSFPTSNFQAADLVLGQTDFISNAVILGTNAVNFRPQSVYSNGNQIFISDDDRVLIWDSWPTSNGAAADRVLGQSDLDSGESTLNNDAALSGTGDMFTSNEKLFLSDRQNNRVLIFQAP